MTGRIVKGVGGLYTVDCGENAYECRARGIFKKQKITPLVGDYAEISVIDDNKRSGYILKILPRENELLRPRAANIDLAVIVFSVASPAISPVVLDKFIVLIEKAGLDIILCFNKTDLISKKDFESFADIYRKIGYAVILSSAHGGEGIDELLFHMKGRTSVLAGPSGVGKSSIVNAVLPEKHMATGELSRKIERGKNTTRHAELIKIPGLDSGFVADTPGFTSLSAETVPRDDLRLYFREFGAFLGKCRYNDCIHDAEPDCAVKAAVGDEISVSRYESYIYLLKETGE